MTRLLYTVTLPESSLRGDTGQTNAQKQLSKLAGLTTGGTVTPTGSEPDEVQLSGQFRGKYADILTREVLELLAASGLDTLSFSDPQGNAPDVGYYVAESPGAGRVQPQSDVASRFSGTLVREGTRQSHRRRIRTQTASVQHGFGTATDAPIGIPASATNVMWLDTDGTESQAAGSPDATVTAEFGAVDQYRADTAPTGNNPQLIYDLPHADAGDVDVAVFDTYGNPEEDPSGVFGWGQVFDIDHEFERGDLVIENGLIRLSVGFGSSPLSLTVEEYGSGSWTTTALGTSDWRLADIDLQSISPVAVRARTQWTDTGGSDTHVLDLALHRGWETVQFYEPADSTGALLQASQAPAALETRLSPIASQTLTDPDPRRGLIKRDRIPLS